MVMSGDISDNDAKLGISSSEADVVVAEELVAMVEPEQAKCSLGEDHEAALDHVNVTRAGVPKLKWAGVGDLMAYRLVLPPPHRPTTARYTDDPDIRLDSGSDLVLGVRVDDLKVIVQKHNSFEAGQVPHVGIEDLVVGDADGGLARYRYDRPSRHFWRDKAVELLPRSNTAPIADHGLPSECQSWPSAACSSPTFGTVLSVIDHSC